MTLPIAVDKQSGIPIYVQLAERIRLLVREGRLKPGDSMPTVRKLAVDLGVNANTVARVYRDLQADGVLRLERGLGTSVADTSEPAVPKADFRQIEIPFNLVCLQYSYTLPIPPRKLFLSQLSHEFCTSIGGKPPKPLFQGKDCAVAAIWLVPAHQT